MDFEDKKYFKRMSNYNPKGNIKGYYQLMINNSAQEALSGENSSIKAKMKIEELLISIEESGMVR